jgi:hypothetical protein
VARSLVNIGESAGDGGAFKTSTTPTFAINSVKFIRKYRSDTICKIFDFAISMLKLQNKRAICTKNWNLKLEGYDDGQLHLEGSVIQVHKSWAIFGNSFLIW